MDMDIQELKKIRKSLGLSQKGLAGKLGVARETVARWETGKRKIPPYLWLALETVVRRGQECITSERL